MPTVSELISNNISNAQTNIKNWKNVIYNAIDYGAKGDGITDDTAAIQKTINDAGSGEVWLPRGYVFLITSDIVIQNKTNLRITGGGKVKIRGTNTTAFRFSGTCNGITIDSLEAEGDGLVSNAQTFVGCPSGQNLTDIKISNNYVNNMVVGISINSDLGGSIDGAVISENRIENIVGIDIGQGYGIHVSHHDMGVNSGVVIEKNVLKNTFRHAIYIARGSGYIVSNNTINDHRKNASDPLNPRAAINVSRSSNVVVDSNNINNAYTGAIMVTAGLKDSGYKAKNIIISNNLVSYPKSVFAVSVGYLNPDTTEDIDGVIVIGNTIITDLNVTPITMYYGKNITVTDNILFNTLGYGIIFVGEGESGGSATFSDNWTVKSNTITASSAYRLNNINLSSIRLYIENNRLNVQNNIFTFSVNSQNPNYYLSGHGFSGAFFTAGNGFNFNQAGPLDMQKFKIKNVVLDQDITANRPSAPTRGQMFYDTSLSKPIWWNGTAWKDATGTTV